MNNRSDAWIDGTLDALAAEDASVRPPARLQTAVMRVFDEQPVAAARSSVGAALGWVLVPAAVVGTVALRRRSVAVWPLLMTFVIVSLTAVLFYGIVRFRVPAEVALVVLAGVGIDAAWRRLQARRSARPVVATA